MKVFFWNIQDAYNSERLDYLNEPTNDLDIIILSEAKGDYFNTRITNFSLVNFPQADSASIKVFINNNLTGVSLSFKQYLFRKRILVFDLKIDKKKPILLFCMHLKSKALIDEKTQLLTNILATSEIHELHEKAEKRSIIVGDFNHNPYETLISSVHGLNCISSKTLIDQLKSRPLFYHKKDIFFNPMWKFYSTDNDFQGTFFYKKRHHKKADDIHWNMFDQVVISKSLMHSLDIDTLSIVTSYYNTIQSLSYDLAHERFLPIHKTYMNPSFSDHLPITFKIDINKIK